MNCVQITVALLSISVCHHEPSPQRLPGLWVGTLESGSELTVMRAEFFLGRSGLSGALHLEGAGDLTVLRAGENRSHVYLVTGSGDDEFVFVGVFREGAIVGRVLHAGVQLPFELHRTKELPRCGEDP